MPIPTYFSHSYRLEDQSLNQTFWRHFSDAGFSFFVDPPSDTTIHTHLERMMRRCSAFVAIANRRRDVSSFFCSRFVLYECGLSIQARRPRLLLIDERVGQKTFQDLPEEETHYFSAERPHARKDELARKIDRLRGVALNFPNRLERPRGPIAVLIPQDRTRCAYADPKILSRIRKSADLAGFGINVIKVPYEHNAFFALHLDEHEAVILDVRGKDLPEWVFAYAYGRLVPTIKLAHVRPDELPANLRLPPLVEGLRMDESEPGVESVTYWRDAEDLVWQLGQAFRKLDEEQTAFKDGRQGELYFESIGRRPANVFISNAGAANGLGRRLSDELRLRNIQRFQYKDPGAIRAGSDWKNKIRGELRACDILVALIGQGYRESEWCLEEMKVARARLPNIHLLPYAVERTDVGFMDELQVAELPGEPELALDRVLKDVQELLTRDESNATRRLRRTTLLGASRESVIDAIRHVRSADWPRLLTRMDELEVAVNPGIRKSAPVRTREIAEDLFISVQRADTDPASQSDMTDALVRALANIVPRGHRRVLGQIASRIAGEYSNGTA